LRLRKACRECFSDIDSVVKHDHDGIYGVWVGRRTIMGIFAFACVGGCNKLPLRVAAVGLDFTLQQPQVKQGAHEAVENVGWGCWGCLRVMFERLLLQKGQEGVVH